MTGRVRSLSSRSGQALCWPRIAEIPLQGLMSAVALILCTQTGVSELLAHNEWGGVFFPLRKGIFCVQKMRRNDQGQSRYRFCVSRTTAVYEAGVDRDWGHTPI